MLASVLQWLCFSVPPLFILLAFLKANLDLKWPLSPHATLNGRLRCQVRHPIQGDKWISTTEKSFLRVHIMESLIGSRVNLGEKRELTRCCLPSENPLRWRLSKLSWFKNYHYAIKWPISSVEPVILAKMAMFPPHLCDKLQKYKTQATLWTACAHDGGMSPNHLEMLAHHRLSGAVSCRITFISHSVIHYIIQLIHWLLLLSLSLTMWSGPISFGLFF